MATEAVRMFKKDYYARLAEIVRETAPTDSEELINFIDSEIELLSAKASKRHRQRHRRKVLRKLKRFAKYLRKLKSL